MLMGAILVHVGRQKLRLPAAVAGTQSPVGISGGRSVDAPVGSGSMGVSRFLALRGGGSNMTVRGQVLKRFRINSESRTDQESNNKAKEEEGGR